tara:strand:- start:40 stop:372 length:333 start_codon:yes stop_codon:yes gene_type:complete
MNNNKQPKKQQYAAMPGGPKNLSYKQAKGLATSGRMQARLPGQFTNGQRNSGPFSPQAEAKRKQDKTMGNMRKGLNKTVDALDITGAQKAKIFDQIDPKNNGPQRGKLGY